MPAKCQHKLNSFYIYTFPRQVGDIYEHICFSSVAVPGQATLILCNFRDPQLLQLLLLMISVHSCKLKVPVRMCSLLMQS